MRAAAAERAVQSTKEQRQAEIEKLETQHKLAITGLNAVADS
ncbi:hypothetical protein [Hafnia alvei]|nr:hypothetical protein [Hafnia alvei]